MWPGVKGVNLNDAEFWRSFYSELVSSSWWEVPHREKGGAGEAAPAVCLLLSIPSPHPCDVLLLGLDAAGAGAWGLAEPLLVATAWGRHAAPELHQDDFLLFLANFHFHCVSTGSESPPPVRPVFSGQGPTMVEQTRDMSQGKRDRDQGAP